MKRINNLFEKIYSIENLELADIKARKGKTKSYGVRLHDLNKENNILELQNNIKNLTFKTSKYTTFKIYEPKERLIYRLPYYPDRILHHAIMNILEPIWNSILIRNTFSCIKGRGIHDAVFRLQQDLKNNPTYKYCLKFDIKKFYPSIDNNILKNIIRRKIKDKNVLILLDEIIDSTKGVPIGNYLSQYFANIYLSYFDHWCYRELGIKYYYRYADDIVILSDNKNTLHQWFIKISEYLKLNLNLEIKSNHQVFPISSRGIDFVGYKFFHSHIILRKRIKKNIFKSINKLINNKILTQENVNKYISGYYGWMKFCNSKNLTEKIFNTLNKDCFKLYFGKTIKRSLIKNKDIKLYGVFNCSKNKFIIQVSYKNIYYKIITQDKNLLTNILTK